MARPCKVFVQLPEVERVVPWLQCLDLARRVEEAGHDSIWVGDHLGSPCLQAAARLPRCHS